jgi:hypothetical protein
LGRREDGDALAGHLGLGLQFVEDGGVAQAAAGADLRQQRFGGTQARLAERHQRAGARERPVGDLGVADQVEGRGAQGEPAAERGLAGADEGGEVDAPPAAGQQRLDVGEAGAEVVTGRTAREGGLIPLAGDAGAHGEPSAPGELARQAQVGVEPAGGGRARGARGGVGRTAQTVRPTEGRIELGIGDDDEVLGVAGFQPVDRQAKIMAQRAIDGLVERQDPVDREGHRREPRQRLDFTAEQGRGSEEEGGQQTGHAEG